MKYLFVLPLIMITLVSCSKVPYNPFVVSLRGKVSYATDEAKYIPITRPLKLPQNVYVMTGDFGETEIQIGENYYVVLLEDSKIKINAAVKKDDGDDVQDFQVDIIYGKVQFRVTDIDDEARFKAVTDLVQLGVEGTGFQVISKGSLNNEEISQISVVEGTVTIKEKSGKSLKVGELKQSITGEKSATKVQDIPEEELHCLKDIENIEFLDFSEIEDRLEALNKK